jgi:hypothetical protein
VTGADLYFSAYEGDERDTQGAAIAFDNFLLTSESCPTAAMPATWGAVKGAYR